MKSMSYRYLWTLGALTEQDKDIILVHGHYFVNSDDLLIDVQSFFTWADAARYLLRQKSMQYSGSAYYYDPRPSVTTKSATASTAVRYGGRIQP